VELLKQGQYQPMPVEKQVVSLFAGTNGFLDEIPLGHVLRYEKELLETMEVKHADLLTRIAESRDLSKEASGQLTEILTRFTAAFKTSVGA
jgi:F-type H+-transporting ATPase subunit alpha